MAGSTRDLTADRVREILDYGPQSGEFRWRERADATRAWNTRYAGKIAGTINTLGYRQINIGGRIYYAHRLAWLVSTGAWPENEIDHRDENRANNRLENLRDATHSENAHNRRAYANNTSGFKGVSWDKARSQWAAVIQKDGRQTTIGRFATAEEAYAAYCAAAAAMHGEFARTGP